MATVAEIRHVIKAVLIEANLPEQLVADLNTFLSGLERHDDMSVASFLQMMSRVRTKSAPAAAADNVNPDSLTKSLTNVFGSDDAFRAELMRIQSDRRVSREALNLIYESLSGRARRLPAKATKARLAQDIADLRLERVRSERAAELFKGKPIYAE